MKKFSNTQIMLMGIALIAFFPYAKAFTNETDPGIFGTIVMLIGMFSPVIGLILCIVSLFIKDKEK